MSWVICWKHPLLTMSKCLKLEREPQEQRGGAQPLAHKLVQSLQIEALGCSSLWAAATDFLLWSLALCFPVLQSSWCTVILAQTFHYS